MLVAWSSVGVGLQAVCVVNVKLLLVITLRG